MLYTIDYATHVTDLPPPGRLDIDPDYGTVSVSVGNRARAAFGGQWPRGPLLSLYPRRLDAGRP